MNVTDKNARRNCYSLTSPITCVTLKMVTSAMYCMIKSILWNVQTYTTISMKRHEKHVEQTISTYKYIMVQIEKHV